MTRCYFWNKRGESNDTEAHYKQEKLSVLELNSKQSRCLTWISHLFLSHLSEASNITTNLKIRKLKLRDVKTLNQNHTFNSVSSLTI